MLPCCIARVDLCTACTHVQQFREVSLASGEAFASLNTTHDEFNTRVKSTVQQ